MAIRTILFFLNTPLAAQREPVMGAELSQLKVPRIVPAMPGDISGLNEYPKVQGSPS